MARSDAVWGIDIGQCSLKALRCTPHDQQGRIVAEAFDYIEYPKILSQPGADPGELVGDALKQFLSRNSVKGDRVALAVPGQSGLARFIKLPPVESKKIPDIVRYEARQQIPFDLADVVWDYQRMGGGSEEEGFSLETEIGLFAMKREQVFRALEPLRNVGIEVDLIQLTPLALYNFLLFDQMPDRPPPDEYDPENPPASVVVLSLGTDATDLIVTNGYRVWQRSIPLGGSHFTKALTKELKLTFAKAEHLKRNATAAQDPKAVFQAMRPVFNDLLTEVQRSLGYFMSLNRRAKLGKIIALGNAMKLPGLRKYLSQSLGFEVVRPEGFRTLSGSQVLGAPAFKENQLSFGVCYGLAVQTLGQGTVITNLLPQEIVKDRLIREKKPWAVAAAAALMVGCTIYFASVTRALSTVAQDKWLKAEGEAKTVKVRAEGFKKQEEEANQGYQKWDQIGVHLMGNVEGRIVWLEMLRAVNECLPSDPPDKRPQDISERNQLFIDNVEAQKVGDLTAWFAVINQKGWYQAPHKSPPTAPGAAMATPAVDGPPAAAAPGSVPNAAGGQDGQAEPAGPSGSGWVVQLTGFHLHNFATARADQGAEYVRNTLIESLRNNQIALPVVSVGQEKPTDPQQKLEVVSMSDLGISYPVLVDPGPIELLQVPDPDAAPDQLPIGAEKAAPGPDVRRGADASQKTIPVRRFKFVVQFVWQPTPPSKRAEKKAEAEKARKEATAQP